MTVYGEPEIDLKNDDDQTIRPDNAAEIGFVDPDARPAPAPAVPAASVRNYQAAPDEYPALPPIDDDADDDSLFAELAAEAKRQIDENVYFDVELRPGWIVGFHAVVGQKELKRYRNAATANGKRKETDPDLVIGNVMPIVEKSIGIFRMRNGKRVEITDPTTGRSIKLGSTKFIDMFAPGGNETAALVAFLGSEADITKLGEGVLRAAGWGGDGYSPLDPTDG